MQGLTGQENYSKAEICKLQLKEEHIQKKLKVTSVLD